MRLTEHFLLEELIRSQHHTIDNTPPADVIERLAHLCKALLEPLRDWFGPIFVTSGYRCPALNTAVGGVEDSAHIYGCAADIVPVSWLIRLEEMMRWAVGHDLPFDQLILESTSTARWIHAAVLRPEHETVARKEALVYHDGVWSPWQKEA
jgi:zinc D-Ala-D-Ala carboxypeptidase